MNPKRPLVRFAMKIDCTEDAEARIAPSFERTQTSGRSEAGRKGTTIVAEVYKHGIDHDVAEQERAQQQIALLSHRVNLLRIIRRLTAGRVQAKLQCLSRLTPALRENSTKEGKQPRPASRGTLQIR